ncbi:hypothetical protein A3D42_02675 [Candidatus Nomurabacteria bacterium RIFCSPHIGHO2_02_FULL_41_18]|uniref:Uncharacterized protein n=1 Tax=Candidatus Nomurabacteria bacterium RIFCSPHIGHO2_02_FULL_41_18 TaxID=1801754 RepID=A0A1F6W899_9BACT|nr:MAG: hypothetical protein A3D42_02675 [Candidatus Nomurabacteria bacterium RIFCSPHIGHO2_02_FULL_41_18]
MNSKTCNCQNCKTSFIVEPEDFEFYARIKVPPPTFCPECRMQRRMAWRNERLLYKRKDAFGKDTISIYAPNSPFAVYPRDYWWSDAWDSMSYGREYDFSKPFFLQFRELLEAVPVAGVFSSNVVESPYTNHVGFLKNCYLTFASWECEGVYYSDKAGYSKDSFDLYLTDKGELCYWVIDSIDCYKLFFSAECSGCADSYFLLDCKNCQNCFGCVGLRNKRYYIFNKPYSKEEYEKKVQEFDIGSFRNFQAVLSEFSLFKLNFPHKYARLINTVKVTGNNCVGVKNCFHCFDMREDVEDSKYVTHGGFGMKDSYDGYGVGICELLYEGIDSGVDGGSKEKFSVVVYGSRDTDYCFNCANSSDLFGCVGLQKKQYCILNKQYTKEEYNELKAKIVEHMHRMPYIDKNGMSYRYGEFFPIELSPFAYNETIAQEYYPLTEEKASARGYDWIKPDTKERKRTMKAEDLPDHIKNTPDSIAGEHIGCINCKRAFRILKEELVFLKASGLPLPRQCPDCRHTMRFSSRNLLTLFHRKCQCAGPQSSNGVYSNTVSHSHSSNLCPNEFETSYAPERPEIVYCEACYNSEVA